MKAVKSVPLDAALKSLTHVRLLYGPVTPGKTPESERKESPLSLSCGAYLFSDGLAAFSPTGRPSRKASAKSANAFTLRSIHSFCKGDVSSGTLDSVQYSISLIFRSLFPSSSSR